jgi:hypothetical protein
MLLQLSDEVISGDAPCLSPCFAWALSIDFLGRILHNEQVMSAIREQI